jgi:hypothetical protein
MAKISIKSIYSPCETKKYIGEYFFGTPCEACKGSVKVQSTSAARHGQPLKRLVLMLVVISSKYISSTTKSEHSRSHLNIYMQRRGTQILMEHVN